MCWKTKTASEVHTDMLLQKTVLKLLSCLIFLDLDIDALNQWQNMELIYYTLYNIEVRKYWTICYRKLMERQLNTFFRGNPIISPLHVIIDQIYVHVSRNQILCLQELLRFNRIQKDVLYRGRDQTPLMTAASKRATPVLEVLCRGGCQTDLKNLRGFDAAYYCLKPCLDARKSAYCLQVLIQHGYPLTNRRVITWAINTGSVFALSVLADANMDLDSDIPKFNDNIKQDVVNPLLLSVLNNFDVIVLFLIKAGCKHHFLVNEIPQNCNKCVMPNAKLIFDEILEYYVMVPRSLRDLCRIEVRKSLGSYPRRKIFELKLPRLLANYISGTDFLAWPLGTQVY